MTAAPASLAAPARGGAGGEASVPLLLGALVGALGAGRLETAGACVAVALALAAVLGARVPRRSWLATAAAGAVLAWVLNLYLTPGRPLAGLPVAFGRMATEEGARHGLLLVLRMGGAFAALLALAAVCPAERAADGIAQLLRPLRRIGVPVGEARTVVGLALRFAPLVSAEATRIARVQDLRAGRPPRGAREWLERRRAAAVPTLVGSLERAERVALALEGRHYRVREPGSIGWPKTAGGRWSLAAGIALALTAWFWRG
jgi:energy-coupling factor transporter transmembrane protein EcfT